MDGQSDLVSEVAVSASVRRAMKYSVFSVTVTLNPVSNGGSRAQEHLSDVIEQVESHGWKLEQTSTFRRESVGEVVLLIFRA